MAKLSGVKTLDMTNGEVTKVEYNGEVYAKVDGKAQVGDIVQVVDGFGRLEAGDFGEVVHDNCRDITVPDGVGHRVIYRGKPDRVIVFRKVNAAPYALVTDREPKAGDFVKFSQEYVDDDTDLTAGKYYKIKAVNGAFVKFDDDEIDERFKNPQHDGVEVYEKVAKSETITHNGATYTLVDRKAQPGDVVVFMETDSDYFTNGKPYGPVTKRMTVVDDEGDDCLPVYLGYHNRTPANVKVYEPKVAPVVSKKPLQAENTALRVGDYAKVINASYYTMDGFVDGEIVKIIESSYGEGDKDYRVSKLDEKRTGYILKSPEYIVRATDEEVAKAHEEQKFASINEGDYVKIIAKNHGHRFKIGAIVIIKSKSSYDFSAEKLDGSDYWYVGVEEIEKLSAEEADKISAEQADVERWAAIGRKPNEFKKGDIVREECGNVGEVDEVEPKGYFSAERGLTVDFFDGTDMWTYKHHCELITPVEARFDRQ